MFIRKDKELIDLENRKKERRERGKNFLLQREEEEMSIEKEKKSKRGKEDCIKRG